MKIGNKIVIRASAQTWMGLAPGASHFYGVIENTETDWADQSKGLPDEETALKWATAYFFRKFDVTQYILVVGCNLGEWVLLGAGDVD